MSGLHIVGGRKLLPTISGGLKAYVEEYLRTNQELTYINIEEMTTSIQSKSYRFSRMNRKTFAQQVEQAYYSYCNENSITFEDGSPRAVPRNPQGQDSDSDIEIQDPPPRPTMNNQLNSLYQLSRPTTSVSSPVSGYGNGSPNSRDGKISAGIGRGRFTAEELEMKKRPYAPVVLNEPERAPNTGSVNGANENPFYMKQPIRTTSPSLLDTEIYDDDDLQIIQEFPIERSPMASASSVQNSQANVPPLTKSVSTPKSPKPSSSSGQATPIPTTKPEPEKKSLSVERSERIPPVTAPPQPPPAPVIRPVNNTNNTATASKPTKPDDVGTTTTTSRRIKRKLEDDEVSTSSKGEAKNLEEMLSKNRKREIQVQTSSYTFSDFGGSEKLLEEICKLLMHLKHPEMYRTLGVTPPRGFLLHGPPGVGKTLLAQAIAGELKLPILKMAATELISGISGESERNIRDVFDQALSVAPCIIFMDEIDSITPKRENAGKEMERRIVAQLLSCIDDLVTKPKGDQVLLIGATSRIEAIDTSLRRAGRFDREICLGIPNESAREKILRVISKGLKLETDFDFTVLAKLTPGYVGADLQALVREAATQAVTEILTTKTPVDVEEPETPLCQIVSVEGSTPMEVEVNEEVRDVINLDSPEPQPDAEPLKTSLETLAEVSTTQPRSPAEQPIVTSTEHKWITEIRPLSDEELANFCITMKDFEKAHKCVQPSAKREGFATVPDTTWNDIGALADIRDELQVSILGPVKYSSAFEALGLNAPAGVLLCGPPGCGKTLLAKAVANEAGINFISVKGPELLNMYVGESERAVRQCFQRAKNSAPCVIFFDELDSLCPRRSDGIESGSSSRVVNQLLTEMDGMESRLGVFVMGATNRPDIIDPAILRPGRLDKVLFVNLPSPTERVEILKAVTKNGTMPKFADDVNIEEIGLSDKCENYTGADLASLVREAGIAAFRELILGTNLGTEGNSPPLDKDLKISQRHFEQAFTRTKPSVSQKDRMKYDKMKELHSITPQQ